MIKPFERLNKLVHMTDKATSQVGPFTCKNPFTDVTGVSVTNGGTDGIAFGINYWAADSASGGNPTTAKLDINIPGITYVADS